MSSTSTSPLSCSSNSTFDWTENSLNVTDDKNKKHKKASKSQPKPSNSKAKLCPHNVSQKRCPSRLWCEFAHGEHELKIGTTVTKSIHPEYGRTLRSTIVEFDANSEHFKKARNDFQNKIQKLHKRKGRNTNKTYYDNKIMTKIKQWNAVHPKGPHYYDFHGLTVKMAEKYIKEIIKKISASPEAKKKTTTRIETGRGNHSIGGVPAIRNMIREKYEDYKGATFEFEEGNDGILIMTFN